MTLIISKGLPVHRLPQGFSFLGEGNILGVPFVLWLLLAWAIRPPGILENPRLGRAAVPERRNVRAATSAGLAGAVPASGAPAPQRRVMERGGWAITRAAQPGEWASADREVKSAYRFRPSFMLLVPAVAAVVARPQPCS